MSEVLDAAEAWALVSLLTGWLFARASSCLREAPVVALDEVEPDVAADGGAPSQRRPRTPLLELVHVFDEDLRAAISAGAPPSHL
ncbi:MAG TPA: hypothetical protein VGN13_06920 [Solirubrobacteraceae bacterium]|jgi:hypothetical protein